MSTTALRSLAATVGQSSSNRIDVRNAIIEIAELFDVNALSLSTITSDITAVESDITTIQSDITTIEADIASMLVDIIALQANFSDWTSWIPASIVSTPMTYTVTTAELFYMEKDNYCLLSGRIIGNSSGSASSLISLELPIPAIEATSATPSNGIACTYRNAGSSTNQLAHCFVQGDFATFRKTDAGLFNIGNNLGFGIFGGYRI